MTKQDSWKNKKVWISMAKPASPHENAIAERVNGILKEEWPIDLENRKNLNVKKIIGQIVKIYNEMRPHNGLGNITPAQVHDKGFLRHDTERVIGKKISLEKEDRTCSGSASDYQRYRTKRLFLGKLLLSRACLRFSVVL